MRQNWKLKQVVFVFQTSDSLGNEAIGLIDMYMS
jgi:hypothetical protein